MNRRRRYKAKRTRRMRDLLCEMDAAWPKPHATVVYVRILRLCRLMGLYPPVRY